MRKILTPFLMICGFMCFIQHLALAQREVPLVPNHGRSAIAAVHPDEIYYNESSQLMVFLNGQPQPLSGQPAFVGINALAWFQGRLWVATRAGLYSWDKQQWQHFSRAAGELPSDTVTGLAVFANRLAIACPAGLVVHYDQTWQRFHTQNSALLSNQVNRILSNGERLGIVAGNKPYLLEAGAALQAFHHQQISSAVSVIPYSLGGAMVCDSDRTYYYMANGQGNVVFFGHFFQATGSRNGTQLVMLTHNRFYLFENGRTEFRGHLLHDTLSRIIMARDTLGGYHIVHPTALISYVDLNYVDRGRNVRNSADLNINKVTASTMNRGDLFNALTGHTFDLQFPGTNDAHRTFFTAAPWIGGLHQQQTYQSLATYRYSSGFRNGYYPGPLKADGELDEETAGRFDRIWKINRFEVEAYKLAWQRGEVQSGTYSLPENFATWPGNHPFTNQMLAPFFDRNGDGIYDPMDGDYPMIKGDQALWYVFNDQQPNRTSPALGVEFSAMLYAYQCNNLTGADAVLNYTAFLDYTIHNRSGRNYDSTYFSFFTDLNTEPLGGIFIQTDVEGNGFYGFSGTDSTLIHPRLGYFRPAQGIYIMRGPTADQADGVDNNRNGLIDEPGEDIAISNLVNFGLELSGPTSTVENHTQAFHAARSRWRDGEAVVFGGNGYPGSVGSTSLRSYMMYPAGSDSLGWSVGGNTQSPVVLPFNWSFPEMQPGGANNTTLRGRAVASMGPFSFAAGASQQTTLAFVYSPGTGGYHSAVQQLRQQHLPLIRQWYANDSFPSCLDLSALSLREFKRPELDVRLYPNPAREQLFLESAEEGKLALMLYDLRGRLHLKEQFQGVGPQAVDISTLTLGMYLLFVEQNGSIKWLKFIRQ